MCDGLQGCQHSQLLPALSLTHMVSFLLYMLYFLCVFFMGGVVVVLVMAIYNVGNVLTSLGTCVCYPVFCCGNDCSVFCDGFERHFHLLVFPLLLPPAPRPRTLWGNPTLGNVSFLFLCAGEYRVIFLKELT